VALLWRAAALAYAEASRNSAAAEALAKGALAVEQHDPKVRTLWNGIHPYAAQNAGRR